MSIEGISVNDISSTTFSCASAMEGELQGRRVTVERGSSAIVPLTRKISSFFVIKSAGTEAEARIHAEENLDGSSSARGEAGLSYDNGSGAAAAIQGYSEVRRDPNGNTSGKVGIDASIKVKF